MELVLKTVCIYVVLLAIFRLTGKRSLGQITMFDFVLLLIIGESVQQGLVGRDYSVLGAVVVVTTLLLLDVAFSLIKQRSEKIDRVLEGVPLVIVENGRLLEDRMRKERVDESDVMCAARLVHGLERLDQIKYAVLERDGEISVIPKPGARP